MYLNFISPKNIIFHNLIGFVLRFFLYRFSLFLQISIMYLPLNIWRAKLPSLIFRQLTCPLKLWVKFITHHTHMHIQGFSVQYLDISFNILDIQHIFKPQTQKQKYEEKKTIRNVLIVSVFSVIIFHYIIGKKRFNIFYFFL